MSEPLSGAQRQATFRLSGRQVSVVLRDPVAIQSLERLVEEMGGVGAAITNALKLAGSTTRKRLR